jgi:hypothetical protein
MPLKFNASLTSKSRASYTLYESPMETKSNEILARVDTSGLRSANRGVL